MKRYAHFLLYVVAVSSPQAGAAQPYNDSILAWQQCYKREFLHDNRSPLTATDTGNLRFYSPTLNGLIQARFRRTPDEPTVSMATHSGKTKIFRQYGIFTLYGHRFYRTRPWIVRKRYSLVAYVSGADTSARPTLFIPFTDLTNLDSTYPGGRYLDLTPEDYAGFHTAEPLEIDFNRAYNPWCAYKEGYNCPIPPKENRLSVKIEAGEKRYIGPHKD